MNNLTLEGAVLKILKTGETLPYRFPLNSTFIAPNPAKTGFTFKYENYNVECIATESTANGGSAFSDAAAMDAQLTLWNQTAVIVVDVAEISGTIIGTNLALEHVDQDEDSFQTSAAGATYVALASHVSKEATVYNDSGTTLEFRRGSNTKTQKCFPNSYLTLGGHTNTSGWSVRRLDQSNTQVTVVYTYSS